MQHSYLVRPAEYARLKNLSPSTVSRQLKSGRIPGVRGDDGVLRVDVVAADAARKRNIAIISGHGGKPDRVIRQSIRFRARYEDGYEPSQKALLCVTRSAWPALMQQAMQVLGADELNTARAVIALQEMVVVLACCVHDDMNRGRTEFTDPLTPIPELAWSDPEVKGWVARWGRGEWTSDEGGMEGGFDLWEFMFDAAAAARP